MSSRAPFCENRMASFVIATCLVAVNVAAQTPPSGPSMRGASRSITLEDILRFERPSDVLISPDGKSVIYVLVKPGPNNVYGESSALWLLDVPTRKARILVSSLGLDPQPQWSPDGQQVAYLSAQSGQLEIWLLDVTSGGQRQITRQATASAGTADGATGVIREFVFSPTGDQIALVRAFSGGERQQQLEQPKIIAVSEHPHFFSSEGADGSFAGKAVIETISLRSGRRERLTSHLNGAMWLQWSPDGTRLAFMPLDGAWRGSRIAESDPTILTVATGEMKSLVETRSADYVPTWSPDGSVVCYISHSPGEPSPFFASPLTRSLYTRTLARDKPQRMISGDDIAISFDHPIIWPKTNIIYAASRRRATTRLYAFAPDGSSRRLVTPEQFHVRAYSLSADGQRVAAILENANTPPEIYVGDPATGQFERLTDLGRALDGISLGSVEIVKWRSGDDRFDVEGFLVKPPDFTTKKRYPLLVNMHGGPRGLYENAFVDVNFRSSYHTPAQLYAANGYVVFLPNKRGDESYGADFVAAHTKHWGDDVDYDMLAGVEALIARGLADPAKLGVMGASYGGTATAWAIARTNRFKAASINDGPVNLLSYYGQAYFYNDWWMDAFMGGNPSAAQSMYLEKSPILQATKIETPTLLRYGQKQFPQPRAMPLQGMELFRALHERGVPVEFLYHPTQGHVISDEEVYRDWVRRNLRWFDYWVLGKGTNPLARALPQATTVND